MSSSEEAWFDHVRSNYDSKPSKGSALEFFEQSKQVPMQAIGGSGDIWQALHEGSRTLNEMPELSAYPRMNIPESPLPTSTSVGESLGYEEPTTAGGRFGKRIFGNIGAALPLAAIAPSTAPLAIGSAALGGAAGQATKELGGSEGLATGVDIATSLGTNVAKNISKAVKPSGVTERWFEKIAKTKKMSPENFESLKGKIEEEAKNLTSDIFSRNETYNQIKNFPIEFSKDLDEGLNKVQELAKKSNAKVSATDVKSFLSENVKERQKAFPKITPTETQKAYNEKTRDLFKYISKNQDTFSLEDILQQYRANNKELGKLFEITSSEAANEGKKSAIMDYQKSLANVIDKEAPGSELSDLFRETNKKYSDAMNISKIDSFIEDIFSGNKINYKEARRYYTDKQFKKAIKSTFGDKTEKDFNQIMKDFLSQEKGMSRLKSSGKNFALTKPSTWMNSIKGIFYKSPKLKIKGDLSMTAPVIGKMSQGVSEKENKGPTADQVLSGYYEK